MTKSDFQYFFQGSALKVLQASLQAALTEDGEDLTSKALFSAKDTATAKIVAKEDTLVVGLPLIALIFEQQREAGERKIELLVREGAWVEAGTTVVKITASACTLLGTERTILNYIAHLSGIANLTRAYVQKLEGTNTVLLDTRKTLPGLRLLEKYAVLAGGGKNHRLNLEEMLMLKDNHIDRAGSITRAVTLLQERYGSGCPPIEVECRNLKEVEEASSLLVQRIMLDNMSEDLLSQALAMVPAHIETEVSGNVTLDTVAGIAKTEPDFISVGRLTHSARAADFSMQITPRGL